MGEEMCVTSIPAGIPDDLDPDANNDSNDTHSNTRTPEEVMGNAHPRNSAYTLQKMA